MNSKAIKRQLLAAIAMVLVAAVALGSSTYAWFVTNNTVKATTATISAQSNAPFLMIDKTEITKDSLTSITFNDPAPATTKLYPAQVVIAENAVTSSSWDENSPVFQSAYASAANKPDMLTGTRFDVGTPDTAAKADTESGGGYALKETFKIGTADTKAGSFKNLKVSKVELNNTTSSDLAAALSVLVVGPDGWAVYKQSDEGTVLDKYHDNTVAGGYHASTVGVLADTITAGGSVDISVYIFYDGSEEKVYTENLTNLAKAIGATVSFTATPVSTNGTEGPSTPTV